ncbi:MAG: hypothetical protein J3R72DRAFT_501142, partial [Linnemannia gamsii]
YPEPSDGDEQDHEQDLAQNDQQGDRQDDSDQDDSDQDDSDQDEGNNRDEGQDVEVTGSRRLRQLAYQDILSMLGHDNVEALYRVEYGKKKRQQLFFLLEDRGFFCSCLRLQSMGIVCRHFFAVMRVHSSPLRYHISLIPRRWFREEFQFNSRLDLKDRAFVGYDKQDCTDKPVDEYMERARSLSVKDMPPSSPVDLEETMDNCRRYEVAKDLSQFMRQQTSFSEADNNILSQCVEEAKRKFQAIRAGVIYVEDPNVAKTKGRARSKRLKSQAEIASGRARKKFQVHDSEINF